MNTTAGSALLTTPTNGLSGSAAEELGMDATCASAARVERGRPKQQQAERAILRALENNNKGEIDQALYVGREISLQLLNPQLISEAEAALASLQSTEAEAE